MNKTSLILFSLFFVLFILFGCAQKASFGFKQRSECDTQFSGLNQQVAKMKCYHTAALTSAGLGKVGEATGTCTDIWNKIGLEIKRQRNVADGDTDDQLDRANLEADNCFLDVAKVLKQKDICLNIIKRDNKAIDTFKGESVTQELCIGEVNRTSQFDINNYNQKSDNLCSIVFVSLFSITIATYRRNKKK